MKAYSLDLRQRVLQAALSGDHTIAEVAGLFGVGTAFVNKMLRLHRAGVDLAPRPHGGGYRHASCPATRSCCARRCGGRRTQRSKSCAPAWRSRPASR